MDCPQAASQANANTSPQTDLLQPTAIGRLGTLSPTQQTLLARQLSQQFQQWKQARSALESNWRACWDAYLCDLKPLSTVSEESTADRSRVVRPLLYEAVETIQANLLNTLFPAGGRFFSVVGQTEADHDKARLIEEFMRQQLDTMQFEERYALFLKQAIITGNSVAALPWKRMQRQQTVHYPVEVLGILAGTRPVVETLTLYDGPAFEVVDIFDFVIDPAATRFEEATVIRRLSKTLSDLKQAGVYHNLQQLEQQHPTGSDSRTSCSPPWKPLKQTVMESEALRPPDVTIYEAWGDFLVEGTVYANHVCVASDSGVLLRFEPNPYDCGQKPFVFTSFIPLPNEVYGLGAIEKTLGLQHAVNTLTNQKLDVINISINNPFTYLINDDVFDPETVVTRPGALIPVKSHDTLRPIQYLNNFTVAFQEIADLKAEVQEATGAFKYFTGAAENTSLQGRTATEVQALVQGGNQKYSSLLAHLEHESLEPFLNMAFAHMQQFVQEDRMVRFVNGQGQWCFESLPQALLRASRCQFRISGARAGFLKQQELEGIVTFLKLLREAPAQLLQQIDVMELYRRIYRRLGFKDEDIIFHASTRQ